MIHKGESRMGKLLKSGLFKSLVFSGLVLIWIALGIRSVSDNVGAQQAVLMEEAIRRCAVQCYALEGSYPASLAYMQERYGLAVDNANFAVHYENLGANLFPEVSVFSLK